jgi:magnesium-transporting ATPase (P-type)
MPPCLKYICSMTSEYFTYEKKKVIQALRYHFITRREIKTMIILLNVFALISAALFFFKKVHPTAFLVSSLLWIILMIAFWFLMPQMIYKKSPSFQDRLKASLNNNTFTLESQHGSRSWAWADFSSWMESPHFFHLYFTPRSFFIIPKDAFEGDNVHEARKLIGENVKRG